MHILLADDDYELRRFLCMALAKLPAAITEAKDGQELRSFLLGNSHFDLVVSDIRMPRRNGLDVALEARRVGVTTPIIFLTGFGDDRAREIVAGLGNAQLLAKPVDWLDLMALCRRMLCANGGSDKLWD